MVLSIGRSLNNNERTGAGVQAIETTMNNVKEDERMAIESTEG